MAILYSSFLFVGGAYLIGLAVFGYWRFRSAIQRAQPVTLRVLEIARDHDSEEYTLYTPTFEILEGANKGSVVTGATSSDGHHKIGETIDGLYDPESGTSVSAKDLQLMKWMPLWAAFFGMALLSVWIYRLF